MEGGGSCTIDSHPRQRENGNEFETDSEHFCRLLVVIRLRTRPHFHSHGISDMLRLQAVAVAAGRTNTQPWAKNAKSAHRCSSYMQ